MEFTMVLEVIHYPNKILRQISHKVNKFDAALHAFLDDMYETMIQKRQAVPHP